MTVSIFILLGFMLKMKKTLYLKNETLLEDNQRDGLTGIYNRRFLNQYILRLWKSNSSSSITVFMMDLDYFKDYNDTYGHLKGDEVLKNVARIISKLIRNEDVLARYGGEEFAVLLLGTDCAGAQRVSERIRETVQQRALAFPDSPVVPVVTISTGFCSIQPREGLDPEELVRRADEALYRAKRAGRNTTRGCPGCHGFEDHSTE